MTSERGTSGQGGAWGEITADQKVEMLRRRVARLERFSLGYTIRLTENWRLAHVRDNAERSTGCRGHTALVTGGQAIDLALCAGADRLASRSC